MRIFFTGIGLGATCGGLTYCNTGGDGRAAAGVAVIVTVAAWFGIGIWFVGDDDY